MKRAGKLFLMIILVLAMVLTSTGVSNVMSVFAESFTSTQSVEESKEKASTSTGTEEQQKSKQLSSEKDGKKEEDAVESTTASKAKEETTAKKEETKQEEETKQNTETKQEATTKQEETVNKEETTKQETTKKKEEDKETPSEATTETQKSSKQSTKQEDEITIQAGDTETPMVEEIPLDEYIKVEQSGIYITIDGKQETLTSIKENKKEIPTGAPVEIMLEYGAIDGLTENTKLVYQLPSEITITKAKTDGVVKDGNITAGSYTITTDGKITISLDKKYLEKRGGSIKGGTITVKGKFKDNWGENPGEDTIVFGRVHVTFPFQKKQVSTKAELSLNKEITQYDKDAKTITYKVTAKAPADNTQDMPDVKVEDVFTTNGDQLVEENNSVYQNITAAEGTTFDASTGVWQIGTVKPGETYTLEYTVKIKDDFFKDINKVNAGIKNTATAYSENKNMGGSSAEQKFSNNLNISKVVVQQDEKNYKIENGHTYVYYKVKVEAPADNTNDMTNVVVKDIFLDNKELVQEYSEYTPSRGTVTADSTSKSLQWNIGTMTPGQTVTLTYRVKLSDDVWEAGKEAELNKTIKNKATVSATGMNDKDAGASVQLHKVWIWKDGYWQPKDSWTAPAQGTGRMKFIVHANESTYGAPILNKNFTFHDELTDGGEYVYDGDLIIRAYTSGPASNTSPKYTDKKTINGQSYWDYTPTGNMRGAYFYEFEYYARPSKSGHGGPISNNASIGIGGGTTHTVNWKNLGDKSGAYLIEKKYVGGVGTGKAKWKTTIPTNVYNGVKYVDTLKGNQEFTEEQIGKIAVKLGDTPYKKGDDTEKGDYTVSTKKTGNKITGFTITFNIDTENVESSNPITIEYESTVSIDDLNPNQNRTFTNTGRIYYSENIRYTREAKVTYNKKADFEKKSGKYDASNKQLTWYLNLNENSNMEGDATITEKLPDGLKFISAKITNSGSEAKADGTAISVDENTVNSNQVKINVMNLVKNTEGNANGSIQIEIVTEVTDKNFLLENTSKTFTNQAFLELKNGGAYESKAEKTITNTALSKQGVYDSDTAPYAEYVITVNPNGYDLLDSETEKTIKVVDQMSKDMILMEGSVKVSSKGQELSKEEWSLSNDTENHKFILTVPDDKALTISYKVSISKPTGESVELSNEAWYEGYEKNHATNTLPVIVKGSSATVSGALLLEVQKSDAFTITRNPLEGATFGLAQVATDKNGNIIKENREPKLINETSAKTDSDGKITFKIEVDDSDKLYCVYEKEAPSGYQKSDQKVYVAFKEQKKAGDLPIQYVQNGGAIEMSNVPVGSLTITKKVIGNVIPEEDQKNGYQMKVTPSERNQGKDLSKVSVKAGEETLSFNKEADGSLTFHLKAGQTATITGLPTGTYSVTENVDTAGRTYNVSYSGNNEAIEVKKGETSDVTVTNTYKTELKVLKKDSGAKDPLSGAQLAIYNASDVSVDSNGSPTVTAGATAVASWTSGTDAEDLTGKVAAGGSYVLVEKAVPTSDYVQAAAIPFTVDAEGRIQVADAYANNYDDSIHTITLNNQKKTGSLTVKKIIEDGEAGTAFDFTVTFTSFNNGKGGKVTVTRKDKDGKDQTTTETVTPDKEGNLKLELKALTNNETVKISGIPYGTSYTVTETQKEGYLETANSNLTGVIGDNGTTTNSTGVKPVVDAEASITNTRLTGFTVKKLAEYGQYTPDAETKDNKQFKFKVTLTRKDQPYTGKFTLKYSDSNKEQGEEVTAQNGIVNITLKDTQTATFSNLPSGTKYTVEEVADANYDASVKVNNTVQNVDSNNNADNNKNVAATAEGTINKTGDTVEFTNTRKLGAFSFTKTVKGNTADKEQAYDFYVEVDGKPFNSNAAITQKDTEKSDDADTQDKTEEDKRENTAGTTVKITDGKLSLKDGQTATIAKIPAGVSYSIKETTGDRYVTLINNKVTAETTGTVEEGKTSETQFVNQVIHLNVTKTDLTGQKEVAGAAMTLYKAEDVNKDGTVKDGAEALDSWVSGKESFHDFGPAVKAGESYVLIETAAPDGYAYAENITFTVNEDGTIKTDAEKITDKETGDDIYLVKDDVTRVSVKKMDITGQKEVAGARLLLKDKDGNVIESWMSTTEARVFEQKLIAGETYTLTEVTAPSGYEVAADITFTVNKDGTVSVDGKAVDGNEIVMKDETTPVGEEGKLVVSKLVTFQGRNQAVNRTFYVALFSDADCTKKVSNVKELKCEGAWSAYTVFEHLKDGTYYVAETDEEGNKLESSEACKIKGNGTKCEITPTQKTAYAVIENQLLIPGDDFLNTLHDLTVTKNVTLDGNPISDKYNGTFYVSLFTDPYYTNRIDDVKALQIQNGKSTSVSFTDLADGTYYVAETDKDGNPVENTDFGFDVTYDGDIAVSFTEQNTDSTLGITNDMTERNPEYDKYLKEEDDNNGDNDKNKNNTSNHSSNKTTKKGKNSKTGDYSHILFYAALAAAALVVGSAEMYRRTHRAASRKNKHDR